MSKTKIGDGYRVSWTATAAKSGGDVIVQTGLVGVALADAVTGSVIALELFGQHRIAKPTTHAFVAGAPVYVTAAGAVAASSAGNQYLGIASEAATSGSGETTVYVLVGMRPSVGDV